MTALHPSVERFLSSPPARGGGLNVWIMQAAHRLRHYGQSSECIAELHRVLAGHGVKPGEIERAVAKAFNSPITESTPVTAIPKPLAQLTMTKFGKELIIRLHPTYDLHGVELLYSISPESFDGHQTESIIDILFPGNPLLCVGIDNSRFQTASREELRGTLESMALIVPSPMSALAGTTQDGRVSAHTLDNTGPRRFFVVDQDTGSIEEQAIIVLYLRKFAKLVMVLHSGGKSLHAWFYVAGMTESECQKFMALAVRAGADRSLMTKSQFVRMPDGTRQTGERQTVHYFDSTPLHPYPQPHHEHYDQPEFTHVSNPYAHHKTT